MLVWHLEKLAKAPSFELTDQKTLNETQVQIIKEHLDLVFTKETFTAQLLQRFRRPLVSTSANISGEKSPAFFDEISEEIKNQVDYIVEYRQDDTTPVQSSSIIKLGVGGQIEIIRK